MVHDTLEYDREIVLAGDLPSATVHWTQDTDVGANDSPVVIQDTHLCISGYDLLQVGELEELWCLHLLRDIANLLDNQYTHRSTHAKLVGDRLEAIRVVCFQMAIATYPFMFMGAVTGLA